MKTHQGRLIVRLALIISLIKMKQYPMIHGSFLTIHISFLKLNSVNLHTNTYIAAEMTNPNRVISTVIRPLSITQNKKNNTNIRNLFSYFLCNNYNIFYFLLSISIKSHKTFGYNLFLIYLFVIYLTFLVYF